MYACNKRFKRIIKKYGFKIRKIPFRPDILTVQFMNKHMFVIPRVIYPFVSASHTDMAGHIHPDYFELERKAGEWNMRVKRSNYLEESWYEERHEATRELERK